MVQSSLKIKPKYKISKGELKHFDDKLTRTLNNIRKACLPVPYVSQNHKNWCVPAALMMVLKYYKHPYGTSICLERFVEDIEKKCEICVNKKGVTYEDVKHYFADRDFWLIPGKKYEYFLRTWEEITTMKNIEKRIKDGIPPIVWVKKWKTLLINHALVVVGCSNNYVCFHDPAEGEYIVYTKKEFNRMCNKTMIILTREPS